MAMGCSGLIFLSVVRSAEQFGTVLYRAGLLGLRI